MKNDPPGGPGLRVAKHRSSLDQRLQPGADQLGEHRPGISRLQRIELGKQGAS